MALDSEGVKHATMDQVKDEKATFHARAWAYFSLAAAQGAGMFTLTEDEWLEMKAYLIAVAPVAPDGNQCLPVD